MAAQLVNCKGFITALPVHWVENEDVLIKYPTAIIVEAEPPKPGSDQRGQSVEVASMQSGQHDEAKT